MKRYLVIMVILVCAVIANMALTRSEVSVSRFPLKSFPQVLGDWKTVGEHTIDGSSMAVLLVDDYIVRTYYNEKEKQSIGLYIGYFQDQREGKQIHSPRQCLPGAGYEIERKEINQLVIPGEPVRKVSINLFVMRKGDERRLYLWWYQGRGRMYASEFLNKYYQILDIVTRRRSDGALVRLDMQVQDDVDDTLQKMIRFISQVLPIASQFIPE